MKTRYTHRDTQLEKDLRTLKVISIIGLVLIFVGFVMMQAYVDSYANNESISGFIFAIGLVLAIAGMALAKLKDILTLIFNPKENAEFKKNAKASANEWAKTLGEFFPYLAALGCVMFFVLML